MCNSMFLDQRAHVVRLGAHAENHLAAVKHKALNAGTRQWQIVRDRKHDQKDRIPSNTANARGGFGIVSIVVVRARNQLRDARGPAGQLKNRGIRWVDPYRGEGRRWKLRRYCNHVRERQKPFAWLAENDPDFQGWAVFSDASDDFGVIAVAMAGGDDAGRSAGDLHELADFRVPVSYESRNRDGADLLQRKV